jgi:hypothetical protein
MIYRPIRIQLRRTKGWRMPENTVKVDRSTRFGNFFRVGEPVDVEMLRRWGYNPASVPFLDHHCVDAAEAVHRFGDKLSFDRDKHPMLREQLGGKNLACWCALDQPCHADVLLELANRDAP